MSPASTLAIQRSAGNAALCRMLGHPGRPSLQRAIVAIDGPGEGHPSNASGRATRACLWNLTHHKRTKDKSAIGNFGGGDARGKVAGPAELSALAIGPGFLSSDTESLYILAHGSRYKPSIGDMTPKQMASWLKTGFAGVAFRGKVKLVSCHSASDASHRKPGDMANVYNFPDNRSYAQELARLLAPSSTTDPFQPASVQGITGIGWVDETTGRLTKIDKNIYDEAVKFMASNSDVGALKTAGKFVNPFTDVADPAARAAAMRQWFADPKEANAASPAPAPAPETDVVSTVRAFFSSLFETPVPKTPAGTTRESGFTVGKGHTGKRTFTVGSGAEIP
jgi:hypothetical protein